MPVYATTNGSAVITVTLANHGYAVNDTFPALVSTTVATVVIFGDYVVASTPTANTFTFTAGSTANANDTGAENAGDVRTEYLLASGLAVNTPQGGWGTGDWGDGDWGLSNGSAAILLLRQWSLDHWGEDLIACPSNGGIYSWSPPDPSPAVIVPDAPLKNVLVFAMPQAQILIACGASVSTTQFPTLIRWCDSGNREDWTAGASDQAGSFQLPTGSRIIAGLAVGLGALVWTDVDMWSMAYQGLPFVFGFNRIAVNCEALSQRACAVVGNSIVWPSDRGFFRYDGSGVAPLDCTVWSFMFNNLDTMQDGQVFSAVNTLFDEVAWWFPIDTASPIYDAAMPFGYVKWNYAENVWDYGQSSQCQRTAWVDHSPVGNPIGADTAQMLQEHEISDDANGQPMEWFYRTGYFDLDDGGDYVRVDRLDPDFSQSLSGGATTVLTDVTIYGQDFPDDTPNVYGPFTVTSSTPYCNLNIRHRQLAVEFGGDDLGTTSRLGAIRIRMSPSGRR